MPGPNVQAWLDAEWLADQAADEAALVAALAADAAADAVVLAAKDAVLAKQNIELAKLNAAIDHVGILGHTTHPFDWLPHVGFPLNLTGYVETFRDDFTDPNTIMGPTGTGGKWYSPVHSNFGFGTFDISQITVANGQCRMRNERVSPPSATSDWGVWKTSHMQTLNAQGQGFKQLGGYFEARVKLPQANVPFGWVAKTGAPIVPQFPPDINGARGSWSGFWLLSDNDFIPSNTDHHIEMDQFECYGGDQHLHSTVHLKPRRIPVPRDPLGRQTRSKLVDLKFKQFDGNFHDYGVLYDDDFLTIYFDGKSLVRYEMNKFLKVPMYINLTHTLFKDLMHRAASPMDMYVEHVRAMAKV